jgi:hypothetical protein
LCFSEQIDNFINLLDQGLFSQMEFFEQFAMEWDKEQKNQEFNYNGCKDNSCSDFSCAC